MSRQTCNQILVGDLVNCLHIRTTVCTSQSDCEEVSCRRPSALQASTARRCDCSRGCATLRSSFFNQQQQEICFICEAHLLGCSRLGQHRCPAVLDRRKQSHKVDLRELGCCVRCPITHSKAHTKAFWLQATPHHCQLRRATAGVFPPTYTRYIFP